jgi:hypothetical protein
MNTKIVTAALLLAGLVTSVRAQTFSASEGDLFFGVQEASASTDYVLDLGNAGSFFTGTGTPLAAGTTLTWNVGADLTTAFSSDYKSAGNVFYSIVGGDASGATNAPTDTIWAAGPNLTVLKRGPQSGQDVLIGTIDTYTSGNSGNTTTSALGSSGVFLGKSGLAAASSYSTIIGGGPNSFGYSAWGVSNITSDTASGNVAALYELQPGSGNGIDLGTFTLNTSTGILTFTAIPEPSTYAMILGVFALGFVMLRRRQQVTA